MSNKNKPIFNIRMDPETKRKLEELAKAEDRDYSKQMRYLINQAWEQKFSPQAQPTPER